REALPSDCAHGGDVEADIVQRRAHARNHPARELLAALVVLKAREGRREGRGTHESGDVVGGCGAGLGPAPDLVEAGGPRPLLGFLRPGEDPWRPADELRRLLAHDRVDDPPNAIDVALASTLNLDPPGWP